jgi:hypothetical protein
MLAAVDRDDGAGDALGGVADQKRGQRSGIKG